MNSRIGTALFILAAIALGWLLKTQVDVNQQQMSEIRDLRAELARNTSANKIERPSAEVFRLRSACADFGQRILEENSAWPNPNLYQTQTSHYDPQSNRCYVELTVTWADLSKPLLLRRTLYDGQTKEMLAHTDIDKGQRDGGVYELQHVTLHNFLAADEYINSRMLDDRR